MPIVTANSKDARGEIVGVEVPGVGDGGFMPVSDSSAPLGVVKFALAVLPLEISVEVRVWVPLKIEEAKLRRRLKLPSLLVLMVPPTGLPSSLSAAVELAVNPIPVTFTLS